MRLGRVTASPRYLFTSLELLMVMKSVYSHTVDMDWGLLIVLGSTYLIGNSKRYRDTHIGDKESSLIHEKIMLLSLSVPTYLTYLRYVRYVNSSVAYCMTSLCGSVLELLRFDVY